MAYDLNALIADKLESMGCTTLLLEEQEHLITLLRSTIPPAQREWDSEATWKRLSKAQDKLLASYRLGSHVKDSVLDEITECRAILQEQDDEQTTRE